MDTKPMMDFLASLAANNSLDWMHAHKAECKASTQDFENFVGELIVRLAVHNPRLLALRPGDLTFKLNRDTRFSADKSPYTPAFRAHISPSGKAPVPVGYFLMLSPGHSFLGGGLFASMFTDATAQIRDYITSNGDELAQIANELKTYGLTIDGEKLKNVPRGHDAEHPQAAFLKYKSWYLEDNVDDAIVRDGPRLLEYAEERFLLMEPFNAYLNKALEGWKMPERPGK